MLKREYFLRISAVSLLFFLMIGILSLISLSPSYFLSVVKEKVVDKEFDQAKKSSKTADSEELQAEIKNSKEMFSMLKPIEGKLSIKDLILEIISKKNSGVRIDGISVNSNKKDQYIILVKGTAKSRELLKSFAENLRADRWLENIDLPISNFAKITDIDFSITLKTAI